MKTFLTLVLGFSIFSSSSNAAVKLWVDGNNLEWTMQTVATTFWRARQRCETMGFRLPSAEDFFEGIDYDLLQADKNPEFGQEANKTDWIWVRTNNVGLDYGGIASKEGDTSVDYSETRHWAFCVRPHIL